MSTEEKDESEKLRTELIVYLNDLFNSALKKNGFDFICTILRVSGMSDPHWDPLEESLEAFEDLNKILNDTDPASKRAFRIALLMYCHAVEMTGPHEILQNVLRILGNQPFNLSPFIDLERRGKGSLSTVPPSAKKKFKRITQTAKNVGEQRLVETIGIFFHDQVRNAFSHSDYCITNDQFRWIEGGPASRIFLKELSDKIQTCFAFYGAFFCVLRNVRHELAKAPPFHKMPQFEVLELLSDGGELIGFKMHFSNGSHAEYSRSKNGTVATNLFFENDGQINFMVGNVKSLEKRWKVNGVPVEDWEALNGRDT